MVIACVGLLTFLIRMSAYKVETQTEINKDVFEAAQIQVKMCVLSMGNKKQGCLKSSANVGYLHLQF